MSLGATLYIYPDCSELLFIYGAGKSGTEVGDWGARLPACPLRTVEQGARIS